jgi:hypothetical protein
VTDAWKPRITITKPTPITRLQTSSRRCRESKCRRFMILILPSFRRNSSVAMPILPLTADRARVAVAFCTP